ncbi:MAG TPA: hypothetical protein DCF33_17890 [Saprospirales bacterium]|nr:hypothetical protein [Saprospirales bacterium]
MDKPFPVGQIREWAIQFEENERSIQWVVRGLMPTAWVLWRHHLVLDSKDSPSEALDSNRLQIRFHQILKNSPAIIPALSAFSGAKIQTVQHLINPVTQLLIANMLEYFQGEKHPDYLAMLEQSAAEWYPFIPAQVRAAVPELFVLPVASIRKNAQSALVSWLYGLLWLIGLMILFYWASK